MTFKLFRKVSPIQTGHYMISRKLFERAANYTLVLSIRTVEVIIHSLINIEGFPLVWFKCQLNSIRFLFDHFSKTFGQVPFSFLKVNIAENLAIGSQHSTILINLFLTSKLFNHIFASLFLLDHFFDFTSILSFSIWLILIILFKLFSLFIK